MDRTRTDKHSVCPQCKDVVEENDGKYILNTIDKYSVAKLQDILRKHNIPGRSSKNKGKLYELVSDLYTSLNKDDDSDEKTKIKIPETPSANIKKYKSIDVDGNPFDLSLDECKAAYEQLNEYTHLQCQEIAKRLGIDDLNNRDTLCSQIKAKLQKRFDATDEKVREQEKSIEQNNCENINTMISDAQNLKDNCEKAKDT